ncbi:hypothetical protein MK338_11545, partial [Streptococcus vestibularis]|jgi:hypothetical protein
LGL